MNTPKGLTECTLPLWMDPTAGGSSETPGGGPLKPPLSGITLPGGDLLLRCC